MPGEPAYVHAAVCRSHLLDCELWRDGDEGIWWDCLVMATTAAAVLLRDTGFGSDPWVIEAGARELFHAQTSGPAPVPAVLGCQAGRG